MSLIIAYLMRNLNGQKCIVLVADNGGEMHNQFFFALPQILVDMGVAERCILAYWPAHHAKCEADRGARSARPSVDADPLEQCTRL